MPISLSQGSTGGGTLVTITGTNLSGTTAVRFGTKLATDVTNVSHLCRGADGSRPVVGGSGTGARGRREHRCPDRERIPGHDRRAVRGQ
ncbi:IPT/TIG domain-containing protein [Streptomyces meridianus]|uniref:IPT/TIG domain-containing protein n=1 Tax=Streptomyces meridianus TaxID=2938945 RepID=UPI003555E57B